MRWYPGRSLEADVHAGPAGALVVNPAIDMNWPIGVAEEADPRKAPGK